MTVWGPLAYWAALALCRAVVLEWARPFPLPLSLRLAHHAYEAGQLLALGLVSSAAVGLFRRFGPPSGRTGLRAHDTGTSDRGPHTPDRGSGIHGSLVLYAVLFGVTVALGAMVLLPDLSGLAGRLARWTGLALARGGLLVFTGAAMVAFVGGGGQVARRGLFRVGALGGLSLGVANDFVLRNDYPGVHLAIAMFGAAFFSAAMTGVDKGPSRASGYEKARGLRWSWLGVQGALCVWAAWAIVTVPPPAVARELFRLPGAVLAPFLARARAGADKPPRKIPDDVWYSPRPAVAKGPLGVTGAPGATGALGATGTLGAMGIPGEAGAAPTSSGLLGKGALVLLVVIDGLRLDVASGGRGGRFPGLEELRSRSVRFMSARSAASGTIWSLATLFSSRYYSQLRWSMRPAPSRPNYYPHEDPAPRFPEILAASGVTTVALTEMPDALNEYGIVRGFTEERCLLSERSPSAQTIAAAAIERLRRKEPGPLFLYLHFLDTHAPYAAGGPGGSDFERYVRSAEEVDRAVVRLEKAITAAGLDGQTTWLLTADHGEAFGEHGTTTHTVSVYDELLRVPLWMAVPGVAPREVTDDVSLVDVGPTVVDLFGCAAPASFMGQSLVPFLRGEPPPLSRPLAADTGRFQQAMLFPDHLKLMRDLRRGTVELYDLAADPFETRDLFDPDNPTHADRLDQLQAFFFVHSLREPGYEKPYRP